MPKASDYIPEKSFVGLLVGRSGSGKSVAEASFPKPIFVLDMDGRFDGIYAAIQSGLVTDPEGIEFEYYPPIGGFRKLDKKLEEWKAYRLGGQGLPYATIIADSITSLTHLAVNFSRQEQGGKTVGSFRVSGPADYGFESNATLQFLDQLRSVPKTNIIASAHIIDKWGKPDLVLDDRGNPTNAYVPAEVIGEKLAIRDNLGEQVLLYFSNVFRFERMTIGGQIRFTVEFATDLAKNSFGIPAGKFDITNKPFYPYLLEVIEAAKAKKITKNNKNFCDF